MTIKQQGGIFGRNPTFNDLTVEGTLTTSGTQTVDALNVTNNLDVDGVITTDGLTVNNNTTTLEGTADQVLDMKTTGAGADNRIYFTGTSGTRGIIYFQHNGGKLRYDVDSNKIFEVTNASGLAMERNVSFTSGQGIDFSATANGSGSTSSELFDDYEEGLFGVTAAASSSGTVTLDYNTLAYTKVGRMVFVTGEIRVSAVSSPVGDITINGLPFANSGLSGRSSRTSFFVEANTLTGSPTGIIQGNISPGGTAINIRLVNNFSFTSLASYLQANSAFKFGFAYTAA